MALHIECPSCGHHLTVSEAARGDRVTCPRCLAEVAVPEAGPDAVQTGPTERRQAGPSCPRCGRTVEPMWLTCPWCDEPLRGRAYGPYGGYGRPDLDVRRDRTWLRVLVGLLAAFGGVGVAVMAFGAFQTFNESGAPEPMIYLAVALLFLAGLTTLIVFVRSGGNPGAGGFRRVVVGTLAMVGGVIALTTCAGIAAFVYLLAVCLSGNGSHL